jgi:hypothetical protein
MDPIESLRRNRAKQARRAGTESLAYSCTVTAEQVVIRLRREPGSLNARKWFVQCDQVDCQYSGLNEPPCPLHRSLRHHRQEAPSVTESIPAGTIGAAAGLESGLCAAIYSRPRYQHPGRRGLIRNARVFAQFEAALIRERPRTVSVAHRRTDPLLCASQTPSSQMAPLPPPMARSRSRHRPCSRSWPIISTLSPGSIGSSQATQSQPVASPLMRAKGFRCLVQSRCSTPPAFGKITFWLDSMTRSHFVHRTRSVPHAAPCPRRGW